MSSSTCSKDLPAELLSAIIRSTLPFPLPVIDHWTPRRNGKTYAHLLSKLTHVSHSWRHAALADAGLWTLLSCDLHESLFAAFVNRARRQPVDVYIVQLSRSLAKDSSQQKLSRKETARFRSNITLVLESGSIIRKLSVLLRNDFRMKSLCADIFEMHHESLLNLQVLKFYSYDQDMLHLEPLPAALRTLKLNGCSLRLVGLGQLRQLKSLSLDLDTNEAAHNFSPEDWRSCLSELSNTLEIFDLQCEMVLDDDDDTAFVRISEGNQIHMSKLQRMKLYFEDCCQFALQLSFSQSVNIILGDFQPPHSATALFNSIAGSAIMSDTDLITGMHIEYYPNGTTVILNVGQLNVNYNSPKTSIPPQRIISGLLPAIRNTMESLHILGAPDDFKTVNFEVISDLIPNIILIDIERHEPAEDDDLNIMLLMFLSSHLQSPFPFPKLEVIHLNGCTFLYAILGKVLAPFLGTLYRRLKQGVPIKMVLLSKTTVISRAYLAMIKAIDPDCLVLCKEQCMAYAIDNKNFMDVGSFRVVDAPMRKAVASPGDF
jgi:hypothetical protein